MRHPLLAVLCATSLFGTAHQVFAYTRYYTDTSAAVPLRWQHRLIHVCLSTSLKAPPPNIKAGSDVVGAARRALAHWEEAADLRFVLTWSDHQSADSSDVGDGISLLTVADTPANRSLFKGETTGKTNIIFSHDTGAITEADIAINPGLHFSTDGTFGTYDLESTFTHEVGHLLGLEHSAVIGAVMQPSLGRNGLFSMPVLTSRLLAEDDRAGVRAIYGPFAAMGEIKGRVTDRSSRPIYGAHVWVEQYETGRVIAGNITLASGIYRISGLPAGPYRVFVGNMSGLVRAEQIGSDRGAYTALRDGKAFRTVEVNTVVKVMANSLTYLDVSVPTIRPRLIPKWSGCNGAVANVPLEVRPGEIHHITVAGDGLDAVPAAGITIASPFLSVLRGSVRRQRSGEKRWLVSFAVQVSRRAPAGNYSVRLRSRAGDLAHIAGGLTIRSGGAGSHLAKT